MKRSGGITLRPFFISMTAILHLKKDRERAVLGRHPWVFSGAVDKTEGKPQEGDLVEVRAHGGRFLGRGFYGDRSICAKLLTFEDRAIDQELYRERIRNAVLARAAVGLIDRSDLNCFRIVHGEGDGLPGLIVDKFATIASIELHSKGHAPFLPMIAEAICAALPDITDVIAQGEGLAAPQWLRGTMTDRIEVCELGVRLSVPLSSGQKTGYFLDQRTNRALVASFAKGKSVLDLFSYIGGFGLHAAVAGAAHVEAVDASKPAVDAISVNAQLNSVAVTPVLRDCFEYLKSGSEQFDIVVVDPPAFVKHRSAIQSGIRGYQNLNTAALRRVVKGGLMVTCSCSQLVTEDDFFVAVRNAASISGRVVRVLRRLGQAECHPTSIFHAEGRYLKGLLLQVE